MPDKPPPPPPPPPPPAKPRFRPPPPPPPPPSPRPTSRLHDVSGRTIRFFREYTDGVSQRGLTDLFDREATHAVTVLAGSGATEKDDSSLARFLKTTWAVFRGLAFKLSPPRRMLFAAALLLPLVGLFDVDTRIGDTHFAIDFSPIWFLAGLAGMTLLLALELVDRVRVRDEIEIARALQRDLLPQQAPAVPGWSIAHSTRPANEIGGDYYDFIPLADGRLALAVGDASGHGVGAGLLMAIAHATFRTALDVDPDPETTFDLLNRVLFQTGGRRAFMTFFYGLLDPETGHLDYAIAGHPYPQVRRVDGSVDELGQGGLPLGLRTGISCHCGESVIAPGDLLVMFSDGLPEAAPGLEGKPFGFDRLIEQVAIGGSVDATHTRILGAVRGHLGGEPMLDDMTLVVVGRDA